MTDEEHAKIIYHLNINPKNLHRIDDSKKIYLRIEVDEDLDLSTVNLHQAIPIRKGLRTKPVKQHSHLEFVKVYKTSAEDSHEAVIEMLSHFGEVLNCTEQTYVPKKDSSKTLKAMAGVKKGDRDVTIRLHSFLPSFGLLRTIDGTYKKVKFTRPGAVKTCARCGRKEKPVDEEDDHPICPGAGDPKKCSDEMPDHEPTQEDVWNFWIENASHGRRDVDSQIQSQITADTIEVFNIHVEATVGHLKTWLDSKGLYVPFEQIKNDQNPRKKIIVNLSKDQILRFLDFDGSFMQYEDGTQSRLYFTAYKQEVSPSPSASQATTATTSSLRQQSTPPIISQPTPSSNQSSTHTSSTTPSSTTPPPTLSTNTSTTSSSTRPIPSSIQHQNNNTLPTLQQHISSLQEISKLPDQAERSRQIAERLQDVLRMMGQDTDHHIHPRVYTEDEQNQQILEAMAMSFPKETSTARHPNQIPNVLPQNISDIETPVDLSVPSPPASFHLPDDNDSEEDLAKMIEDAIADQPATDDSQGSSKNSATSATTDESTPKAMDISDFDKDFLLTDDSSRPDPLAFSQEPMSISTEQGQGSVLPLATLAEELLAELVNKSAMSTRTVDLVSSPSPQSSKSSSDQQTNLSPFSRVQRWFSTPETPVMNQPANPERDWSSTFKVTWGSPTSSPATEPTTEPSTTDSGLSRSRGSSSDNPPSSDDHHQESVLHPPGTITNRAAVVETSVAGDNNNFIDINELNKSDSIDSDIFDDSNSSIVVDILHNTVIENVNKTITQSAAPANSNKDLFGNSSDTMDFRRVNEVEKRLEVLQQRLQGRKYDPNSSTDDQKSVEETQSRRNSISSVREYADEDDDPIFVHDSRSKDDSAGFTPVRPRKKRVAQFSSSPEETGSKGQSAKSLKKRKKSITDEAIHVKNFFDVLANQNYQDGDVTDEDRDMEIYGPPEEEVVVLDDDDEQVEETDQAKLNNDNGSSRARRSGH